jgi:hypothetical protein
MATREGIDFSGPHPSAEALRAAGRDFVLRYARQTGTKPKHITAAEADYWRDNRIDVGIVEESVAERALSGRAAGASDATSARVAVRAVGGPDDGGVIYMAVDFQPTASQMAVVLDYGRGAASVLGYGRTGVYGSYKVCQAFRDAGICRYLWQTYAWSGGLVLPGIHLYQYSNSHTLGGVDVDYDRTSVADWGQWASTAPIEEDDMPLTPADAALVADELMTRLYDPRRARGLDVLGNRVEHTERIAGGIAGTLQTAVAAIAALADDETSVLRALDDARAVILAGLAAIPLPEGFTEEQLVRAGAAFAEQVRVINADEFVTALRDRITPGPVG